MCSSCCILGMPLVFNIQIRALFQQIILITFKNVNWIIPSYKNLISNPINSLINNTKYNLLVSQEEKNLCQSVHSNYRNIHLSFQHLQTLHTLERQKWNEWLFRKCCENYFFFYFKQTQVQLCYLTALDYSSKKYYSIEWQMPIH